MNISEKEKKEINDINQIYKNLSPEMQIYLWGYSEALKDMGQLHVLTRRNNDKTKK